MHKRITRSTLEPGIERKGKVIYKSIKKSIGFGLLAIFVYYLVCSLLPTLANTQASITTTDKKYITKRRGSIDDCLINCESTHSRRIKQTDKHDWFERFNCNLDASSCLIGCYVDVANNARQKGGIPKD